LPRRVVESIELRKRYYSVSFLMNVKMNRTLDTNDDGRIKPLLKLACPFYKAAYHQINYFIATEHT